MPYCENCGNKVLETAKFCTNCGGLIGKEPSYSDQVQAGSINQQKSKTNEESNIAFENSSKRGFVENHNDINYSNVEGNNLSSIFSFQGSIGRQEYGLTITIFLIISSAIIVSEINGLLPKISFWIFFYPALYILIAQSIKRCHDLGKSGWFILIPIISIFFLLFSNGVGMKKKYSGYAKVILSGNEYQPEKHRDSPIKFKDGAGIR